LEVPGASKTIYCSECPYHKEYVKSKYGFDMNIERNRAVSKEYVMSIMNYSEYNKLIKETTIKTIFVATFQIGDNDPETVTHGWFGLKQSDCLILYHMTIRDTLSRMENIQIIRNTGLALLKNKNRPLIEEQNLYIDVIDVVYTLNYDRRLYNVLNYMSDKDIICWDHRGKMCRAEELFRFSKDHSGEKQIIVYKGSFNPPTIAHVNIMGSTINDFAIAKFTFMISVNTVDKSKIDYEELDKRIKMINMLGHSCIVNKNGKFSVIIEYFKKNFKDYRIIFPVGTDTESRMEKELFNIENITVKVFPRTNVISSSEVRKALQRKDPMDDLTVNAFTPTEIIDFVKSNY
jgi:nicotinic acid mononucleotide adenylyltransferase